MADVPKARCELSFVTADDNDPRDVGEEVVGRMPGEWSLHEIGPAEGEFEVSYVSRLTAEQFDAVLDHLAAGGPANDPETDPDDREYYDGLDVHPEAYEAVLWVHSRDPGFAGRTPSVPHPDQGVLDV